MTTIFTTVNHQYSCGLILIFMSLKLSFFFIKNITAILNFSAIKYLLNHNFHIGFLGQYNLILLQNNVVQDKLMIKYAYFGSIAASNVL